MKNYFKFFTLIFILISANFITGCNKDKYPLDYSEKLQKKNKVEDISYDIDKNKGKSKVISSVLTDEKVLSLTFQGMGNEESLNKLLDELDKYNIKATFFVSGIKVAEEPELANLIVNRGHELGNLTLYAGDLTELSYEEKVRQIKRSHDVIKKYTNVDIKYLRAGNGAIDEEVKVAAANCDYENIISYSVNPQDWKGKSVDEIVDIINKNAHRGSILTLSADKNLDAYKSIKSIVESLNERNFKFVPLDKLISINNDDFKLDENWYEQIEKKYEEGFKIINNGLRSEKKVALTFDDWASDDTVDEILDILDKYNIKATFFLRAKGVEQNPSLAYTISQRGHEIASHTYEHINLDTLTEEEIKEDLIKSHEVISNAIQKEAKLYLRPPRGIINEEIAKIAGECGYEDIIMYDNPSALDWKEDKSAKEIANHVLKNNSSNGDIILLHILDNINTAKALPTIIEGLHNKGLEIVTVGDLLNDN